MNLLISIATDTALGQTTDSQEMLIGGVFLIIGGIGTLLFGGTETTGSYTEIFGIRFGREETRKMGGAESWFWGIAMIAGGAALIHFSARP